MRAIFLFALVGAVAVPTASWAKGSHIECNTTSHEYPAKSERSRVWKFYLDDSREQLVSDDPVVSTKTKLYSDTEVEGTISDVTLVENIVPMLFSRTLKEDAYLAIDRKTGELIIVATFADGSGDFETGTCQLAPQPPTKF